MHSAYNILLNIFNYEIMSEVQSYLNNEIEY